MSGTADPLDLPTSNSGTNQSLLERGEMEIENPKSNRPNKKKDDKKKKQSRVRKTPNKGGETSPSKRGETSLSEKEVISSDSEANKTEVDKGDPAVIKALLESKAENERLQLRLAQLEKFINTPQKEAVTPDRPS